MDECGRIHHGLDMHSKAYSMWQMHINWVWNGARISMEVWQMILGRS